MATANLHDLMTITTNHVKLLTFKGFSDLLDSHPSIVQYRNLSRAEVETIVKTKPKAIPYLIDSEHFDVDIYELCKKIYPQTKLMDEIFMVVSNKRLVPYEQTREDRRQMLVDAMATANTEYYWDTIQFYTYQDFDEMENTFILDHIELGEYSSFISSIYQMVRDDHSKIELLKHGINAKSLGNLFKSTDFLLIKDLPIDDVLAVIDATPDVEESTYLDYYINHGVRLDTINWDYSKINTRVGRAFSNIDKYHHLIDISNMTAEDRLATLKLFKYYYGLKTLKHCGLIEYFNL